MKRTSLFLALTALLLLAPVSPVHSDDVSSTLTFTREDDTLHLSWPSTDLGFHLQSRAELGVFDWANLPASYASNQFHVFEPMTQPAQLYRLIKDCDTAAHVTIPEAFVQFNTNNPITLDESPITVPSR